MAVLDALATRIAGLSAQTPDRPVLIGLDGAVAVGKSTLARVLAELLDTRGVPTAVISADGFLLSGAELQAKNLNARKGFPESFDRLAQADFLAALRRGERPAAPRYSHLTYDVSVVDPQNTEGAAVVIVEGVNVLGADLAPFYDLRLYLDAEVADIEAWFLARLLATPFSESRAEALAQWRPANSDRTDWGRAVWAAVNAPNLEQHIASGRARADLVLRKAADHNLKA
jgi:type I pantothenate kinase